MSAVGRRILRVTVVVLTTAMFLSACGADRTNDEADDEVRLAPGGLLADDPEPISPEDIEEFPANSPQATVFRWWSFAQAGSVQNLVRVYDERVINELGADDIAATVARERGTFVSQRPEIDSVEKTPNGTLVTVAVRSKDESPRYESYLLRRTEGDWIIIHDTVLERGYTGLIQSRAENEGASNEEAAAKGQAAGARFRELFLPDSD